MASSGSGNPSPALAAREPEASGTDWRAVATAEMAARRVAEAALRDALFRLRQAEAEVERLRAALDAPPGRRTPGERARARDGG